MFPRETKSEGSQTSWHFIMSNELEEETTCRTWGSLYFPVDILIDNIGGQTSNMYTEWVWILDSLYYRIRTPHYRVCQVRQPVNEAGIWIAQGPLDSSKQFVKMQRLCVRRQLKDQETSFIHRRQHPSELHIFLPAWCVQWRDLTYSMAWDWRGLLWPKGLFLYTVMYRLDTLQQVGFDDEIGFFRVF